MRKTRVFLLFLTFMMLAQAGCSSAVPSTTLALIPVNVCYSALAGTQVVTWYAYENGLFEKYGLKVNLVSIGGGSKSVTALISGDMDICQVSGSSVVSAVIAGQDVVMFAGLINTIPGLIMAQPDLKTPASLKGKTFANDQPGTQTDTGIRLALQQMGLDPEKDAVFLSIGGEPERVAAMDAKQVDATLILPPLTYQMRLKGYSVVYNLGTSGVAYQGTGLATTRHYIQNNRPAVVAFAKAIVEAIHLMKNDPQGTKAVMAKYLQLDPTGDAASLDEAYSLIVLGTVGDIPFPTHPGIQTEIDVLASTNSNAVNITPDQVVDDSILQELVDSGFINSLR
ncbi:MAG TPA: ABC transporter substrate-binding protein [Anaerolineales bacterium]